MSSFGVAAPQLGQVNLFSAGMYDLPQYGHAIGCGGGGSTGTSRTTSRVTVCVGPPRKIGAITSPTPMPERVTVDEVDEVETLDVSFDDELDFDDELLLLPPAPRLCGIPVKPWPSI